MQVILDKYGREKSLKFKLKVITYSIVAEGVGYGVYEIRKDN